MSNTSKLSHADREDDHKAAFEVKLKGTTNHGTSIDASVNLQGAGVSELKSNILEVLHDFLILYRNVLT